MSCLVPKMMLQPLAENAILHGLSGVQDGRLTVTARRIGRCARNLRVWITAVAFRRKCWGRIRRRSSRRGILGLFNVDTILRKHYGESFGLRLENRKDGAGACITGAAPVTRRRGVHDAAGAGC